MQSPLKAPIHRSEVEGAVYLIGGAVAADPLYPPGGTSHGRGARSAEAQHECPWLPLSDSAALPLPTGP